MVSVTEEYITFEAILSGILGVKEADAARRWLDSGATISAEEPRQDTVIKDTRPEVYDTRVLATDRGYAEEESEVEEEAPASPAKPPPTTRPAPESKSAPPPKRPRPPSAAENEYGRASFVGHSDAVGTMARRKARSAVDDTPPASSPKRSKPSVPALEELPLRWMTYVLEERQADGSGCVNTRIYISPEGAYCSTWKAAEAVEAARQRPLKGSIKRLVSWVRQLGRSSRATAPALGDGAAASRVLALQRARNVLCEQERQSIEQRRKLKSPVRKPTAEEPSSAQKKRRKSGKGKEAAGMEEQSRKRAREAATQNGQLT